MSAAPRARVLADPPATEAAGAALGRAWVDCGAPALVVTLEGDLGAGKTTLVRGLLRGLGARGAVRSPTYTLIETYRLPGDIAVQHLDFYRLDSWEAAEHLGFRDLLGPRVLVAVEWASRVGRLLEEADVNLTLASAGTGRTLTLAARTAAGEALVAAWSAALPAADNA